MKSLFTNYDEIKKEIEAIQLKEKNFTFIKKQYFAHELHQVMKSSGFIEAKLVNFGWRFDAKTRGEDYICAIEEEYEHSAKYMRRIMQASKLSEFYSLLELTQMSINFFQNEKNIALDIKKSMKGVSFGVDYESIVRAVMTQSEYQEWLVMVEKELLQKEVNSVEGIKGIKGIECVKVQSAAPKLMINKI